MHKAQNVAKGTFLLMSHCQKQKQGATFLSWPMMAPGARYQHSGQRMRQYSTGHNKRHSGQRMRQYSTQDSTCDNTALRTAHASIQHSGQQT
eukprot:1159452-Pelagomonas_calceolata.AAC.7